MRLNWGKQCFTIYQESIVNFQMEVKLEILHFFPWNDGKYNLLDLQWKHLWNKNPLLLHQISSSWEKLLMEYHLPKHNLYRCVKCVDTICLFYSLIDVFLCASVPFHKKSLCTLHWSDNLQTALILSTQSTLRRPFSNCKSTLFRDLSWYSTLLRDLSNCSKGMFSFSSLLMLLAL